MLESPRHLEQRVDVPVGDLLAVLEYLLAVLVVAEARAQIEAPKLRQPPERADHVGLQPRASSGRCSRPNGGKLD